MKQFKFLFLWAKISILLESCYTSNVIEAGCDEAGRGCLAGPVVAAAVILPEGYENERLNDSKKLSEKARYELREEIESEAIAHAVAFIDNREIDKINILKASIMAMHQSLDKLKCNIEHIIVDGNRFYPYKKIKHTCVVKGDGKYYSIAAASVLAKTYRDDYMGQLDEKHPEYAWKKNKGYPTKAHRKAIAQYGVTDYHRMSFRLLDKQLELKFC